jgi:hypothetical protein
LCPRLWVLASDYKSASEEDKKLCFLETLLKGSFTLLAVKSPEVCLKVSACNIHIFQKIFDLVLAEDPIMCAEVDFKKVFNFIYETIRGLFIYAKEGKYDHMFLEENLIPQLSMVISRCFLSTDAY